MHTGLEHERHPGIVRKLVAGDGAIYRHGNAAQRVDQLLEAHEIDTRQMIDANAQVVFDRLRQQSQWMAGRAGLSLVKLRRVDPIHAPAGDVDVQVTRNGEQVHSLRGLIDRDDQNGVGAVGPHVPAPVTAQHQDVDQVIGGIVGKECGARRGVRDRREIEGRRRQNKQIIVGRNQDRRRFCRRR